MNTAVAPSNAGPPGLTYLRLAPGDPAPWFYQRSTSHPNYAFSTVAGRYVVLCFFGSADDARGRAALAAVQAHRRQFDDQRACFFGVSVDPRDEARVRGSLPGIRFFWDFDRKVSALYGAAPREAPADNAPVPIRQFWIVLDPTLRVMASFPFQADNGHSAVFDFLSSLPPPERFAGFELPAPILILPNVFEPELCRQLIDLYESHGGEESGYMREVDGKTVHVHDHSHKRRKDYTITDPALITRLHNLIDRRVNSQITKVHCFTPTRIERNIVCCYAAEDGAHFAAHRDNTTKGTAHRRFAVSINLNSDFDGGDLRFPEYGSRQFRAPPGGAVVFSGSLLHAVSKVTRGRRYAFLPFLYDEEAARLRAANAAFIDGAGSNYTSAKK